MKDLTNIFKESHKWFYNIINNNIKWERAFLILVVLFIVNKFLEIPYSAEFQINSSRFSDLSLEQVKILKFILYKIRFYSAINESLFCTYIYFFLTILLWFSLWLFDKDIKYINVLNLFLICSIPVIIGEIVNTGLNYLLGFQKIVTQYNTLKIGLNPFFDIEKVGSELYILLYSINPFQIYFVILLTLGIKGIANITTFKAIILAFVFTLIKIITLFKLTY